MWLMLFTHYLFGYVGTALCLIGLLLALCSVYIFTRRQMRSAVATYLTGLSLSDSCLLSLGLIIAINSSIPPNQQSELFYSSRFHKYLFPYVYGCIIWFQFTSVWITIAFAIDRWFAIKWPMLHYTYSSKRACYIVVTIYCLGFIYSFPRFFEYKTEVQHEKLFLMDNLTEDIEHLVITNKVLESRLYHYIVHLILYSVFQSILPLLMLSYFNVELIRSINASSHFLKRFTSLYVQNTRIGREMNTSRYREGSITRSVICLIGLFILCQVPASILHYIHMFYRNHPILYICYDISNFLILVNSAVNFFIFTYFNRKFRRELARVCFHSKKNQNLILRTSSQQSFRHKNSYVQTPQQNLQISDVTSGTSWEYQKQKSVRLLSTNNGIISQRINHLRKKSSDISIQSRYYRSESLINLRTINKNQIKHHERSSIYDFNYKKSKNLRTPSLKHRRRHSERLSLHRKNTPLTINGQHLRYITYKYDKNKPTALFIYNPITYSSTTTTSSLTNSTMNTTALGSSSFIEQNKLFQSITNNNKKSYRFLRK